MISKGVLDQLSPLEAEVLKTMASGKTMKVRDIYMIVSRKQKVALTSVAVMLDRLFDKGLVGRRIETCRGGTRYLYSIKESPEVIEERFLKEQVDSIISRFGDKAVVYFHKRFGERKK